MSAAVHGDNGHFEFNYVRGYTLNGVSISSSTAVNCFSPSAQSAQPSVAATSTGKSSLDYLPNGHARHCIR
jgi:hypothetical protein